MSSAITRHWRALAAILLLALGGAGFALRFEAKPHRATYVLINETGQHDYDLAFKMSLKLAERKSGIENALVLLASLPESKSIEQTASELFTQLEIGSRRNGRGILYLYAAKENLLKIEVSYALEGEIPDIYCRRLEEAAKTYMLSEIPQDFISELIITTNLRGSGSSGSAQSRPEWVSGDFLSGGGGALVHGYRKTLADYEGAIRRLPQTQLNGFLPSADASVSVQRYLSSLAAGIGDPRLPLLTEGSRLFRAVVPRDSAQQQRIGEFFANAAPLRMLYAGNLALAVAQPNHSNLPVVLRRGTDQLWYVDEAKAWVYFHRFEDDPNFFVKYADNPFLDQLRALKMPHMERTIYGEHLTTPSPPADPNSLDALIRAREDQAGAAPQSAAAFAALGDIYLFESNWISKAIASYEKASALAPDELAYRWRLMDLYLNASEADKMLAELKFLAEHSAADRDTQAWYRDYKKEYDFGAD